ncbi:MAG TPA: alpha/beta hydrolase [Thermoanaerobaculia bacterium]|nr:alpha/beta hydrolase [Thermoanaerobaculia bacterium]
MKPRLALLLFFIAASALAAEQGHWAEVNGHRMYYETSGTGRPLLLLHGGGNSIHSSFAKQLDVFARTHSIIAPEQIGHGHTPDASGPLTYARMASDTAALLVQLRLKDVDVVGWSDGGIVALILGIQHPELVRRLVVSGANFAPEGYFPDDVRQMRAKDVASPATIAARLNHLWATSPTTDELNPQLLSGLHRRVLVMAGDHDLIQLDHTIALYRALPDARLCILPGTTHSTLIQRPDWVNAIVASFFDEP